MPRSLGELQRQVRSWRGKLEAHLRNSGADRELISAARPIAAAVCEAQADAKRRFAELEQHVDELFICCAGKREAIKEEINRLPEGERDAALLLYDGCEDPAERRLRDHLVSQALESLGGETA